VSLNALFVASLAALLLCASAHANNGDADPTFGSGGVVIVNYDLPGGPAPEFLTRVLVQPQGYVLVSTAEATCCATFEYDTVVTRVDRSGALDSTFGTNNGVTKLLATSQYDFICGASIAPDGSLLIAVHGALGGDPGAVIKLSADGIPDPNFGSNGVVVVPNFAGADVAGLSNGQVLLGGLYNSSVAAVLRLNADGGADTTFGNQTPKDGYAMACGADEVDAMALQADGKILVAGMGYTSASSGDDFLVLRFTATGDLDTTFNNIGFGSGQVLIAFDRCGSNPSSDFQNRDVIKALAIEPSGDILVAGTAAGYCDAPIGNLGSAIGVARIHDDGTLDNAFGKPLFQFAAGYDTQAAAIAVQGGKIFIAATAAGGFATANDIGLIRLNHSGTPDLTWVNAGYAHYDMGLSTNDAAAGIAFDGSAPLVGGSRDVTYPDTDVSVLRVANDLIFADGLD